MDKVKQRIGRYLKQMELGYIEEKITLVEWCSVDSIQGERPKEDGT